MDYFEPSRSLRDWVELARYAVGTPAPPTHDHAVELHTLLEDHEALSNGHDRVEECLERRDLEAPDGTNQADHVVALLEVLAACREAFHKRDEFDLVTGEAPQDDETPSGATRLQYFLAEHDELVKFRARVIRVMQDCGALDRELDNDRMVNLLRMLMPA